MTDRLREGLRQVSAAVTAFSENTLDYERLLGTIARSVAEVLRDCVTVTLVDPGGLTVHPAAMHDEDPAVVTTFAPILGRTIAMDRTLVSGIDGSATAFVVPHVDLEQLRPRVAPETFAFLSAINVHAMVMVPMRVRGELIGALNVLRHRAGAPPHDELEIELVEQLANHAALAVANARLVQRAQAEAVSRAAAEQALLQSEALRRAEARLVETTMFLDAIVENIPFMVFVKDADRLSFVRFNRAGEKLLGISRADLMGKNDYDFFPKDEADFFVAKDRETLNNRELVDIPEEPIQTRDGERWLHTQKVPLVDGSGTPRFLLGISHDITERKRDLEALRAAKEAAESANRELEAFSYSVAHDLRTPLRAIDGFSQALLEDFSGKLGPVGRSYLDRVRNSAQRMGALIDDLLKLSRVTRSELKRQPVDLAELVRAAMTSLQRGEPGRSVELVIDGDTKTSGDPKLLAIAFDNLCGNAWKFTSKRDGARIELGSKLDAGKRAFFLRDNGVGFDMAYVDKLFGVFHRLHAEADFPGTGIGLATVQRIVQRHGGRVWAEGTVGVGATFYFTLGDPS